MEGLARTIRRVQVGVHGVANGDTEDVVQEALARAIKSGVSLEAEQWLRTVAKRVAIDQHRRRRETPSGSATELERYEHPSDANPEDTYVRQERAEAVREALAALPPRYRKALQVYAEEDSPAAVARRLGMSAAATWTLLSRARTRLRLQLEQVGFVPALVSVARAKWREIAAAGAAAGVAATAALGPSAPHTPSAPVHPKVVQVAPAPVQKAATPAKDGAALPVAVPNLKDAVNDAVNDVKEAPTAVGVNTCLGRPTNPALEVDVELAPESDSLLGKAVEVIPERLRVLGEKSCS